MPDLSSISRSELQSALRRELSKLSHGVAGRELEGDERAEHERKVWELFRELRSR